MGTGLCMTVVKCQRCVLDSLSSWWVHVSAIGHSLVGQASVSNAEDDIMIIALKGAVRDFYSLLTAPRTVSNTYAQEARAQSSANHVQHIERLSRATCRVP